MGQADTSKAQKQHPQMGSRRERMSFAEGQDLAEPALARQDEVAGGRTDVPASGMSIDKAAEQ